MVELGETPALPADRRRAAAVAAVLVLSGVLAAPFILRPLGSSYPISAMVIVLSIAAIGITAVLLWAQARAARSFPLSLLALGYELTALGMLPYMIFFRERSWPQLGIWISADPQTAAWLWVEWHIVFICAAIAFYVAQSRKLQGVDAAGFKRRRGRMQWLGLVFLVATVSPLIWARGLPALYDHGRHTPLLSTISFLMGAGAAGAVALSYRTSRFRTVLDLWLAVACLAIFTDIVLQHFSRQFSVGWYASRLGILLAASAVLWAILFQTASIYAQLIVTAERLRNESLTDSLTGLANRRAFDHRFAEALRDCARTLRPVALLIIDVDHFKAYNDTFGHQAGDDCLRAIAVTLLNNASRARDLVARTGGEELAVIMPDMNLPGALAVAERMRAAVYAAAIPQGGAAFHPVVTISIGVTVTRDPATTSVHDLIGDADRALYRAKAAGRNRVAEMGEPVAVWALPDA